MKLNQDSEWKANDRIIQPQLFASLSGRRILAFYSVNVFKKGLQ